MKTGEKISEHFYMDEFEYSAVAVEKGLYNLPPLTARKAIYHLVRHLLEPLREKSGYPVHITSGYRCPELNKLVGGAPDSQHMAGEAADIFTGGSIWLLDVLEKSNLDFDQAIFYPHKKFLHVSLKLKGRNRRQIIRI